MNATLNRLLIGVALLTMLTCGLWQTPPRVDANRIEQMSVVREFCDIFGNGWLDNHMILITKQPAAILANEAIWAQTLEIWKIDTLSGNSVFLTDGYYAVPSPDASKIAYISVDYQPERVRFSLSVINRDGTNARRLTEWYGYITAIKWSSKTSVAMLAVPPDLPDLPFSRRPWVEVNLDGRTQEILPLEKEVFDLSLDGKYSLEARFVDQYPQIVVRDLQDGTVKQISDGNWSHTEPAWSPDRQYIAFTGNRDGRYDLFVMKSDGSGLRRLTNCSQTWLPLAAF